jgi:2-polyprenyl-6-hydroxyphenyl methylase/3-demethylubiquinone-9 3-methyltransferase
MSSPQPAAAAPAGALAGDHAREVAEGKRFEFGKNWSAFLGVLNDERIAVAMQSLSEKLGPLDGKTFLDIGCGSGLFSLSAAKLGASRVVSIDFDPQSVACARELKRRYFPAMDSWEVAQGSVLDDAFLATLGTFDVVYIWGVAHHTGAMWKALGNLPPLVRPGGQLYTAIYNDQGFRSRVWTAVKRLYCSGPLGRWLVIAVYFPWFFLLGVAADLFLLFRNPLRRYREYKKHRGMSMTHDWYDWLGGYPFEVAKPEEVFNFFRDRGFALKYLKTVGGALGNNEFVFEKQPLTRTA